MNFITLAIIPMPVDMIIINNKIKTLQGKENPYVFGITEEEGKGIG